MVIETRPLDPLSSSDRNAAEELAGQGIDMTTHRTFLAALTAHGVSYEARVAVGNLHDWPYFDGPLRWGLPRIIRAAKAR